MRKYLHVEILDSVLHVYLDNVKRSEKITVEMLDNECAITDDLLKNKCISIPIKSILEDKEN